MNLIHAQSALIICHAMNVLEMVTVSGTMEKAIAFEKEDDVNFSILFDVFLVLYEPLCNHNMFVELKD